MLTQPLINIMKLLPGCISGACYRHLVHDIGLTKRVYHDHKAHPKLLSTICNQGNKNINHVSRHSMIRLFFYVSPDEAAALARFAGYEIVVPTTGPAEKSKRSGH